MYGKLARHNPWLRRLLHLAGYTVTFMAGIGLGAGSGDTLDASVAPNPTVTVTQGPAPTATVTAQTTVTQAPEPPAVAISDGVWLVGADIEPGTYRTIDTVPSDCYWEISTGNSGFDIVANDLPGGGRPTVTLKEEQQFKTSNCGDWTKI